VSEIDIEQLYTAARELTTDLLPRLQDLIPEAGTPLESSIGSHRKHTAAPIPWNDTAAMLYYEIHGDARRYESLLTLRLYGNARFRPGTDEHTTECINRLPVHIAHGLSKDHVPDDLHTVAYALTSWPRQIRALLDEARPDEQQWAKAPGGLCCPHCSRRLMVPPGWDKAATMPDLLCRHCRDEHGASLRYAPDTWIGVLQEPTAGPGDDENPEHLTEDEATTAYELGSSTLRSWVSRGRLAATGLKREGRRTYSKTAIEALLDRAATS
jgi:hypothetical protein